MQWVNYRQDIFEEDADKEMYLSYFQQYTNYYKVKLFASPLV